MVSPSVEGKINLWALPCLPDLFISTSGRAWSTKRKGLRQRKFYKYNRLLVLRVSQNGHAANWQAGSLVMLALLYHVKVHWDGTKIVPGWLNDATAEPGEGPAVDIAPRN